MTQVENGSNNKGLLSYIELAETLGVSTEGGIIKAIDLIKACLYSNQNPAVTSLPIDKRTRVMITVVAALEDLYINRRQDL